MDATPPPGKPTPRLRKADRKRQLLQHAKQLFLQFGYQHTTTEKIAHAAGVSEPVLYRHFESKKALFLEVLQEIRQATVHRWKAGSHVPHPSTQLLLAQLHYVVSRLDDYYSPDEVRLWLYAPHPQLEGRRAIDAIVGGQAVDVIAILDRLDAAVYL